MAIALTVKLQDDVYKEAARYFGKGKLNRNAWINEAVRFFARAHSRTRLSKEMRKASFLVRDNSMEILSEMEMLEDKTPGM